MTEALAETETEIVVEEQQNLTTHPGEDLEDFVTFTIGDQMFGIPVLRVQDILTPDRIAPLPLAPKEVRGSINLRGRIVTVIDVRVRLGLPPRKDESGGSMAVTVEQDHDLYTLLVDKIGDVTGLSKKLYEKILQHPGPQMAGIFLRRFPPRKTVDGGSRYRQPVGSERQITPFSAAFSGFAKKNPPD